MSIYGIEQFSVCCHGNSSTMTRSIFTSSVLLPASLSQISGLMEFELCHEKADIIPQNFVFKQQIKKF